MERCGGRDQFLTRCILFSLVLLQWNPLLMATISLGQYRLPDNAIRTKLDSMFQGERSSVNVLKSDPTWVDYKSWHWMVGELRTDDQNPFIIKAAKYRPYDEISHSRCMVTHGPYQNISRILLSTQAQKIINEHNLNRLRVPKNWVYPISGKNNDISRCLDHEVIIVEECICKKNSDTMWCNQINGPVQTDILQMDQKTYEQLVTLIQKGNFLDITPKNIVVDEEGKLVLIDLEDVLSVERQRVEESHWLLRPIKRYKLQQREKGAALSSVARTGLSNIDPAITYRGQQLMRSATCHSVIKKNIFEIIAIAIVAVAITVFWVWSYSKKRKKNKNNLKHDSSAKKIKKDNVNITLNNQVS